MDLSCSSMDLSGFGRHFSPSTCLFLSPFIFCFLWIARPPNFCPFKSFLLLSSTFAPSHCPVMLSFRLLVLLLLLLLLSAGGDGGGGDGGCGTSRVIVAATTWCVARSSMDNTSLQAALDYACGVGGADCSPISSDGLCFLPNTLQVHASYAMNSYYQRSGHGPSSCDFSGAGVIAMTDPSYGSCVYPSSVSTASGIGSTPPSTTIPAPTTTPVTTPSTIPWTTPVTTPSTMPITTPTPTTNTPTIPTYNPANPTPITSIGGGLTSPGLNSPPGLGSPTASNAMMTKTSTSHPVAVVTLLFLPLPFFFLLIDIPGGWL